MCFIVDYQTIMDGIGNLLEHLISLKRYFFVGDESELVINYRCFKGPKLWVDIFDVLWALQS